MAFLRRTHTCGELREVHIGQMVVLNGWVNTCRTHNNDIFIDLRHIHDLEARLMSIFTYWKAHADFKNQKMDGVKAAYDKYIRPSVHHLW